MRRPRPSRLRIAATTRRSSLRRRSQIGHGGASGSTRLTTISGTCRPACSSAVDRVLALRQRHLLGQRDPVKRGLASIAQARRDFVRLLRQQRNQTVGRLRPPDPCELLANHAMILLQQIENLCHRRDRLRRRQQPQRVPGRRSVDDNDSVWRIANRMIFSAVSAFHAGEPGDFEQPDELVDPGDRQIEQRVDVFGVEPGAVFEDLAERAAVLLQPARERPRRVELDGVERPANRLGRAREGDAERVAEGVGGVGRHQQHAAPCRRFGNGPRRRRRRLADAAFAAVENELRGASGGQTRSSRCLRR